jgi:hypothetical protein
MADDVNSLKSPIIFSEEHGDDEIQPIPFDCKTTSVQNARL